MPTQRGGREYQLRVCVHHDQKIINKHIYQGYEKETPLFCVLHIFCVIAAIFILVERQSLIMLVFQAEICR